MDQAKLDKLLKSLKTKVLLEEGMTTQEFMDRTGASHHVATRFIKKMVDTGKLTFCGMKKGVDRVGRTYGVPSYKLAEEANPRKAKTKPDA